MNRQQQPWRQLPEKSEETTRTNEASEKDNQQTSYHRPVNMPHIDRNRRKAHNPEPTAKSKGKARQKIAQIF